MARSPLCSESLLAPLGISLTPQRSLTSLSLFPATLCQARIISSVPSKHSALPHLWILTPLVGAFPIPLWLDVCVGGGSNPLLQEVLHPFSQAGSGPPKGPSSALPIPRLPAWGDTSSRCSTGSPTNTGLLSSTPLPALLSWVSPPPPQRPPGPQASHLTEAQVFADILRQVGHVTLSREHHDEALQSLQVAGIQGLSLDPRLAPLPWHRGTRVPPVTHGCPCLALPIPVPAQRNFQEPPGEQVAVPLGKVGPPSFRQNGKGLGIS